MSTGGATAKAHRANALKKEGRLSLDRRPSSLQVSLHKYLYESQCSHRGIHGRNILKEALFCRKKWCAENVSTPLLNCENGVF